MEGLSEDPRHNKNSCSTWLSQLSFGTKIASMFSLVFVFTIWLIVIQNENRSLRTELEDLKVDQETLRRMIFVQDCEHLRLHGVTKSGYYYIDPDGPNNPRQKHQDKPPFKVFCDFVNNRTLVPYAEQNSTQIKDWILNRSGSCWQDFTMDCQAVTYNLNGTPNAWWLDNAGGKQYFFNGSFENSANLNIDQGFQCIGNHGRIKADWLLPISGFVYEQPNKETIIGDLTCSSTLDLEITGKVSKTHWKNVKDWRETFEINFDFVLNSQPLKRCQEFLQFGNFVIEFCSEDGTVIRSGKCIRGIGNNCRQLKSRRCRPGLGNPCREPYEERYEVVIIKTYMKFSTTKSSVRFSSFKLNMVQHVEVKMDETGLVKIKVNDQEKEMIDKENHQRSMLKYVQVKPELIKSFASLMNVKITE